MISALGISKWIQTEEIISSAFIGVSSVNISFKTDFAADNEIAESEKVEKAIILLNAPIKSLILFWILETINSIISENSFVFSIFFSVNWFSKMAILVSIAGGDISVKIPEASLDERLFFYP